MQVPLQKPEVDSSASNCGRYRPLSSLGMTRWKAGLDKESVFDITRPDVTHRIARCRVKTALVRNYLSTEVRLFTQHLGCGDGDGGLCRFEIAPEIEPRRSQHRSNGRIRSWLHGWYNGPHRAHTSPEDAWPRERLSRAALVGCQRRHAGRVVRCAPSEPSRTNTEGTHHLPPHPYDPTDPIQPLYGPLWPLYGPLYRQLVVRGALRFPSGTATHHTIVTLSADGASAPHDRHPPSSIKANHHICLQLHRRINASLHEHAQHPLNPKIDAGSL
eukprot:1177823-Prorocentrum_minimum.AAC.3